MREFIQARLANAAKAIVAAITPIIIAALTDLITDLTTSWTTALATSALAGTAVYLKRNAPLPVDRGE